MRLADVKFTAHTADLIAQITGEIDQSNADDLGNALAVSLTNESRGLIVDLSDVDYLDSAGIQLIYRLRESLSARRQRLALVIPTESPAHDALRLAGVAEHVESVETLEEALNALG